MIEFDLHAPRHHFPSDLLEVGLALGILRQPFREDLTVPQILEPVPQAQISARRGLACAYAAGNTNRQAYHPATPEIGWTQTGDSTSASKVSGT